MALVAAGGGPPAVRMIAEYLEHAIRFEQMAEQATDPKFKDSLLQQATAYRKLAEQRAKKLNMPMPKQPAYSD